jgi:hypothetical protein
VAGITPAGIVGRDFAGYSPVQIVLDSSQFQAMFRLSVSGLRNGRADKRMQQNGNIFSYSCWLK